MPDRDEASDPGRHPTPGKPLSAPALRALEEAARRRLARLDAPAPVPEIDGRQGLEPARYGDWEVKGIATDF